MSEIKISLHYNNLIYDIIYDISYDYEVLLSLIFSQIDNIGSNDLILIDYTGRTINDNQDIISITNNNNNIIQNNDLHCEIWCINENDLLMLSNCCTNTYLTTKAIQKSYIVIDTDILLCSYCINYLDNSLVKELDKLESFLCYSNQLINLGISTSLTSNENLFYPIRLYMTRLLYNQSISLQKPTDINILNSFISRLQSLKYTILSYEDNNQLSIALNEINYDLLIKYTDEYLFNHPPDISLLYGLLQWFKCDKFSWCNKPKCTNSNCLSNQQTNPSPQNMETQGPGIPNDYERVMGKANRVELYTCNYCSTIVRFPRYNNPAYLLQHSPTGRCGEFANAFGLLCRAIGFDVRYVFDFTDHVWIEVYSVSLKRFIHLDSCERALDSPLMYEQGWGKKLSLILSISRYGIVDSTARYTRKLDEVLINRQNTVNTSEIDIKNLVNQLDNDLETTSLSTKSSDESIDITPEDYYAALIDRNEGFSRLRNKLDNYLNYDNIHSRKYQLDRELEGMSFLSTNESDLKIEELRGRISGDTEWKISRGENGK